MTSFEVQHLVEHTPCPNEPISSTARRLAIVHGELLLIHPFREGNGRLARWLGDLMALQAGHLRPEFQFKGKGGGGRRAAYLTAVQRAYGEDYELLTAFFEEALFRGAAGRS